MINENGPELDGSPGVSIGPLVALAVGNTRTRVGSFTGSECLNPQSFHSDAYEEIAQRVDEILDGLGDSHQEDPAIVISTVHPNHADGIEKAIRSQSGQTVYRFGRDFQIPIQHTLTESGEMTVGQDRLLCALGAFDSLKQACVVVDAGTAITIDLVDGAGVFHGGAIMPGVSMMLNSMHDATSRLPKLVYQKADSDSKEPGKQTDAAMQLGVSYAVRGAVRLLTERYAEFYEGYPQVCATGGDLGVLEDEELVDSFLPDLQLHGIRVAIAKLADAIDDDDDD